MPPKYIQNAIHFDNEQTNLEANELKRFRDFLCGFIFLYLSTPSKMYTQNVKKLLNFVAVLLFQNENVSFKAICNSKWYNYSL